MTRKAAKEPQVRCAIYTRKSTDEGLDQEFNTLDAQRESAEAYIASQASEGWVSLPDRYDDGGYSGGNMERPALKRLLKDIEDGKVDCIVVYKLDRLSRSLMDFAKMLARFEEAGVSFVAVTQQFNTTTSTGRLMMNVLLSFAQFEREIISERTRDKIAAARRKGKWAGGHPVLGYDIDTNGFKLVVNLEEAERVRQIYDLYLDHQSLMPVVGVLEQRGWGTKQWTTRKGKERGGKTFNKGSLYTLLRNPVYLGKVKYKDEIHEGEHEAIVDTEKWKKVQEILANNGRTGGAAVRNKHGALLRGLLFCSPCGCMMSHTFTVKNGSVRYRYYTCLGAQKRGWHTCPSKSVPAAEIERLVVEQVRAIGSDTDLIAATLRKARSGVEEQIARLETEKTSLRRKLRRHHGEIRKLVQESDKQGIASRLGDLNERVRIDEDRLRDVEHELEPLNRSLLDEREVASHLMSFDALWATLVPRQQFRMLQLLIERIDYDGEVGSLAITFRPSGIEALGTRLQQEEAAA